MYTTGRINTEQDRKFTYSIILWHVRVTVFAVGEKYVLHITNVCVCVCVCGVCVVCVCGVRVCVVCLVCVVCGVCV